MNYKFLRMAALSSLFITPAIMAEEDKNKIWSGSIEFGYVNVSGNTEESSIKSRADVNREKDKWRYNIHFESLSAESDGDRNAEKYFISNRLAYQHTETTYSFAYASYDDDRFSGFDYQATVALGRGWRIINTEETQWDLEAGPGYRKSKVDNEANGDDSEEAILRLFSGYKRDITETATFEQTVNVEAGDDKTISKMSNALKVAISSQFALKVSHTIKYTDEAPQGTKHADTETAVTLTYSF